MVRLFNLHKSKLELQTYGYATHPQFFIPCVISRICLIINENENIIKINRFLLAYMIYIFTVLNNK